MGAVKHYPPEGFTERLYKAWIASKIDLVDLGRRTGIVPNNLYGYMYYGITPNIKYLAKLCLALKVSADYLLFGIGEEPCTDLSEPKKKRVAVRYLTYEGETLSVTEWSKRTGIARTTIHYKLGLGVPVNEILGAKKGSSKKCNT